MIVQAAVGLTVLGGLAHGAYHRNSFVFGRVLSRLPGDRRQAAITFDDGPNPEATPRILDALKEQNVKAAFFILGSHAERWPHLVKRIVDEGHQVGNHGYFHRKLQFKSPAYVKRDLTLGKNAIESASGVSPSFFRAPHGFRNPWVSPIAKSLGERTVGWSLGVWDTDRPGADVIVQRTVEGTRAGSIILLHDGDGYDALGDRSQTAEAVPRIIDRLRANEFELVTLPVS